MKSIHQSYVTTAKNEANRWTLQDDFTLMLMVGKHPFKQIALRLGRSEAAVQRRASRKGYLARPEQQSDATTRTRLSEAHRTEILLAPVEDLSEFLPECDDDPVLPHAGSRTYHRDYKRNQRSTDDQHDS